ncbi:MAG: NAD(+) synthase, partial [Oscillospiraceae bacterium]
ALVGSQCNDLFKSPNFINQIYENVLLIAKEFKDKTSTIIIGSTAFKNGVPTKVAYVLRRGKIIATIDSTNYSSVFEINDVTFTICVDTPNNIAKIISNFSTIGTDLVLFPTAINATAENISNQLKNIKYLSNVLQSAVAISNSGIGDTSQPNLQKAFTGIFECGKVQHFRQSFTQQCESTFDIDSDIIRSQKAKNELPIYNDIASYKMSNPLNHSLLRTFSKTPYLPNIRTDLNAYLDNLFELQAASLANRMKNIGCSRLVIGVSGGLDSTLALLVCVKAVKMLYIHTQNITAVTMKGLGTSTKTYDNSIELMKKLNVNLKDIPIEKSVLQHFSDITHSKDTYDTTYENAQARERTQILFSLANMDNALVVGTGDLSEASLGFCTFGGDHLASFNVNICINKTTIRSLINRLSETEFIKIAKTLKDILDTPISPELLPTD